MEQERKKENSESIRNLTEAARFDYKGGISRTRRQAANQALLIKNARPCTDGTLEVRGGQSQWTTVGSAGVGSIRAIFSRYSTALGLKIFNIKRENTGDDLIYDGGSLLTGTSFGQGSYTDIIEYKNTIFFSNGVKPINYHVPGTSVVTEVTGDPAPPVGSTMTMYKDKMFVGLPNGHIQWSNTGVYSTLPAVDFPALNFQMLGSEGDGVIKVLAIQDSLIAFLDDSYHLMTGLPGDSGDTGDMSWQSFKGVGISDPKHAVGAKDRVYFLATNNRLYYIRGGIITDLDQYNLISEYLDKLTTSTKINASIYYKNGEVWVYIPDNNPATGTMLVYLEAFDCWTVFTNINGNTFSYCSDVNRFFIGSTDGGYIWEQETGDLDLGSKIAFEFIGKQETLGSFWKNKKFELCVAQADIFPGDSLSASYSINNADSFSAFSYGTPLSVAATKLWGEENWGVSTWGASSSNLSGSVLTTAFLKFSTTSIIGRELRIKISGSVLAKTRFLGYTLYGIVQQRED